MRVDTGSGFLVSQTVHELKRALIYDNNTRSLLPRRCKRAAVVHMI